jgi:heme peroxidase
MTAHGEFEIRGVRRVPLSPISEGRFGRMFRRLGAMPPLDERVLRDLAETMREPEPAPPGLDNDEIPAAYTYLGQFIDHDITFDPASSLQRQNDPDALHDFRSPRYDLDSVYGSGPADEPFQYERGSGGMQMLIEPNRNGVEDLPRNSQDAALIGDPRNDENTIVGQLQLVFLKFHNKVGEQVAADDTVPADLKFEETQRRVRWHYQWIVVDDFLRRVVGDELLDKLFDVDPDTGLPEIRTRYYRPKTNPYMPVEFSVAAFRFGHSMVRRIYDLNSVVTNRPIFISGPLTDPLADLRGFRRLPQGWTVDWSRFLPIDGSTPQPSRLIDARLSPPLFDLPDKGGSLAFRNLLRGQRLGLPSGQAVAKHLHLRELSGAELAAPEPTPLWFYILKESELVAGGKHLGPVGGRIVAEVLLGLLEGDRQSWYNVSRSFTPTLPGADGDGRFTFPDLVKFAVS